MKRINFFEQCGGSSSGRQFLCSLAYGGDDAGAPRSRRGAQDAARAFRSAFVALLLAVASLLPGRAPAADYAVQKTFWNFAGTWTNTPTTVTNLSAAIDCTTFTDFSLQVKAIGTNLPAGSFDIVWQTSLDNVNYASSTNAALGRSQGWFSVPITNNNILNVWVTNITVDAIGWWRIRSITNNAGMNFTNISIRAYAKPRRYG